MPDRRRLRMHAAIAVVPLALTTIGLSTALAPPASAVGEPGCQPDRRSTVHADGVSLGTGSYVPCVIDTGMRTGESGLAITSSGAILRSVTTGPAGVAVTTDDGATWKRRALPSGAQTAIADGIVDPDTDRYFSTGAFSAPVFGSDDAGTTWTKGTFPFLSLAQDWPRLFTGRPVRSKPKGYRNNVYECNWTIPLGIITDTICYKSTDGGRTFASTRNSPYRLTDCRAGWTAAQHGRGVVDPHDGTIYLPAGFCGNVEIAVSRDEGDTWDHRIVRPLGRTADQTLADSSADPSNQRQQAEGRFNLVTAQLASGQTSDALAMDARGRLYMTWIDEKYLPVIAVSDDKGLTWSAPARLSPPGVAQGVLPALAVTRDGQVGVSYYATTDKWTWTGYLTIAENLGTRRPTFQSAAATRPDRPLMNEPCCWVSGPQEYTAARWAPDGSLWAAFAAYTDSGDAEGMVGRLVKATP